MKKCEDLLPYGRKFISYLSKLPRARGEETALRGSTLAKEGEEGAALSDVALHLTVGGLGGVGDGNEVGGGRAAERGREPAGGGRAAVRSRDRLVSKFY